MNPHRVMRGAPYFYLAAILGLLIWGSVDIVQILLASNAVIAQTRPAVSPPTEPAAPPSSGPATDSPPGGNRNYVVRRTSQGSPVQVNVSEPAPAAGSSPDKAPSLDDLKDKLDILKWVLSLILAAAGLFTVVQSIAAGFSAQNFQKQSEDAVKRLEKEADRALADLARKSTETFEGFEKKFAESSKTALEGLDKQFKEILANLDTESKASLKSLKDLESQVRTVYPLFEKDRQHAFAALRDHIAKFSLVRNLADGFDRRRRFYERIDLGERQEILAVDRALAYEIAGQNDPPEEFAQQTRQLAQFYWSKFIYELGLGFGSWSDLERAEHLLELGLKKASQDEQFQLLNVLGNVRLERHKAKIAIGKFTVTSQTLPGDDPDLLSAREAFEKSIAIRPNQLRAHHNLAFIYGYYNYASGDPALIENLSKAAALLEQGLAHPNWETQPVPEFRCGTLYNLACIHARLAIKEPGQRVSHLEAFLRHLREAADLGYVPEEDVVTDYEKETGDIYPLLHGVKTTLLDRIEEICGEEICREVLNLKEKLYRYAPAQI